MARKVALITGANKGIGLETAKQLGKAGYEVVIAARDLAKAEKPAQEFAKQGIAAHALILDVTSQISIEKAAKAVEEKFGALDVLINNAGISLSGKDGSASQTTLETIRATFETNFFGLIAVTQAMLPLLRKSSSARIVNLSSILGSLSEHADPNSNIYQMKILAYNSSKAAVNMFTNHLAHELRGTKIKVNAAHPGWVKTDMGGEMAPLDVETGAKTSVMLATLPDEGPSGGYYHLGVHLRW